MKRSRISEYSHVVNYCLDLFTIEEGQRERRRSPASNLVIWDFNVLVSILITVSIPCIKWWKCQTRWSRNYDRETDFSSCLEMAAGGMTDFEMRSLSTVPDLNCSEQGVEQNSLRYKLVIWKFLGVWYVLLNSLNCSQNYSLNMSWARACSIIRINNFCHFFQPFTCKRLIS